MSNEPSATQEAKGQQENALSGDSEQLRPVLKAGDGGPRVQTMRNALTLLGYLPQIAKGTGFDADMGFAVICFQKTHDMEVTGEIDSKVCEAIEAELRKKG